MPFIPTPQDNALQIEGQPLNATSATITATGRGASYDFDQLGSGTTNDTGATSGIAGAGYAPGGLGRPMAIVINIDAVYTGSSNETYTAQFVESADGITWVAAGAAVQLTAAVGVQVIKGFSTLRYAAIQWTLTGTTPSITYDAWLNPNIGN